MIRIRTLLWVVLVTCALSIFASFLCIKYLFELEGYRCRELLGSDGEIYIGVVIPHQSLTGEEAYDIQLAQKCLVGQDCIWKHTLTMDNPMGYKGHKLFGFQALPQSRQISLEK